VIWWLRLTALTVPFPVRYLHLRVCDIFGWRVTIMVEKNLRFYKTRFDRGVLYKMWLRLSKYLIGNCMFYIVSLIVLWNSSYAKILILCNKSNLLLWVNNLIADGFLSKMIKNTMLFTFAWKLVVLYGFIIRFKALVSLYKTTLF